MQAGCFVGEFCCGTPRLEQLSACSVFLPITRYWNCLSPGGSVRRYWVLGWILCWRFSPFLCFWPPPSNLQRPFPTSDFRPLNFSFSTIIHSVTTNCESLVKIAGDRAVLKTVFCKPLCMYAQGFRSLYITTRTVGACMRRNWPHFHDMCLPVQTFKHCVISTGWEHGTKAQVFKGTIFVL